MRRILGLDFGTRRVGAAVSDPRRHDRHAAGGLRAPRPGAGRRAIIGSWSREHEVDRIVIGLPLHTGGREGTSAALARELGRLARRASPACRSSIYDERYTTVDAEDSLIAAGLKRQQAARASATCWPRRSCFQNYLDAGCPETDASRSPARRPGGGLT